MLCVQCKWYLQLIGMQCIWCLKALSDLFNSKKLTPQACLVAIMLRVPCSLCLQVLSDLSKSKKLTPTSIEYVDIAGLVKGASTGEGLGNKFLANIRECDSIVQVNDMSASKWLARPNGSGRMTFVLPDIQW